MADSGMKKVGRWDIAGFMTGSLNKDIIASNTIVLKQIGLELEGTIVKRILSQPSEWPALNPEYLKRKVKEGKSNQMLIATSSMLNAITSNVTYPFVVAGVKRGVFNEEGEMVAEIAAIMNFGSEARNIEPRDFLTKPDRDMRKKIAGGLFSRKLLEFLKKKYKTG